MGEHIPKEHNKGDSAKIKPGQAKLKYRSHEMAEASSHNAREERKVEREGNQMPQQLTQHSSVAELMPSPQSHKLKCLTCTNLLTHLSFSPLSETPNFLGHHEKKQY